jgi:subfamily B ATP-binding cassette protein MsbA
MLDTESEKDQGTHQVQRVKGEVQFENVAFTYSQQDQITLKNVNLKVNAGEVIALVGKTGSGKSTLVYFMMRMKEKF